MIFVGSLEEEGERTFEGLISCRLGFESRHVFGTGTQYCLCDTWHG